MMQTFLKALSVAAGLAAVAPAAQAQSAVGKLTCTMTRIENVIVYTDEKFDCAFKPDDGSAEQMYEGVFKQVGLNLTVTKGMTITWDVLMPTNTPASDKVLAGTYVGGTATIAVGEGGSANVLVGGSGNTITL